jgi:hypothetical protein
MCSDRSSAAEFADLREAAAPLIVEFIGTPGAGKTTLSRELLALFRERGIRGTTVLDAARPHAGRTPAGRAVALLSPPRLRDLLLWQLFYGLGLYHAFGFARENRRLARLVLTTELARPIPAALKRHTLFWFFQLGGRYRLLHATSRAGEALVFDDGFLHRAIALNASHLERPDPDRVNVYVDLLPQPDILVRAIAGVDECERRVRARGVWRHRRDLDASQLTRYLVNAERVAELATNRARERGWNLVEIDTDGRDEDQIRIDMRAAIDPMLGARAHVRHRETVQLR